jgi:hypothetical protein
MILWGLLELLRLRPRETGASSVPRSAGGPAGVPGGSSGGGASDRGIDGRGDTGADPCVMRVVLWALRPGGHAPVFGL